MEFTVSGSWAFGDGRHWVLKNRTVVSCTWSCSWRSLLPCADGRAFFTSLRSQWRECSQAAKAKTDILLQKSTKRRWRAHIYCENLYETYDKPLEQKLETGVSPELCFDD